MGKPSMGEYKRFYDFIISYGKGEPIFVAEVKKNNKTGLDDKTLNVYMKRMADDGILKHFSKGIYYQPKQGYFGEEDINLTKIIKRKYLYEDNKLIGYITGDALIRQLGGSTQIAKNTEIVSNKHFSSNKYFDKKLNIIVKKPLIKINKDNSLYLQFLDLIDYMAKKNFKKDEMKKVINKYSENYTLELMKLFKYAHKTKKKRVIDKVYELC